MVFYNIAAVGGYTCPDNLFPESNFKHLKVDLATIKFRRIGVIISGYLVPGPIMLFSSDSGENKNQKLFTFQLRKKIKSKFVS